MSQTSENAASSKTWVEAKTSGTADLRARLLAAILPALRKGRLHIVLPGGRCVDWMGPEQGPVATVVLKKWRAVRRLFTGGDIGFAEAWIDGDWTSPDLTAVIRLGIQNETEFLDTTRGTAVKRFLNRTQHRRNANSKAGSQRNIAAHYDLGNDFYRMWLDPTMLYSSAMWKGDDDHLEGAQIRKIDRICDLLRLDGAERVLEIGFGWGTLAARLARAHDVHVTGLTLSPAQRAWAQDALSKQGLEDRADLRLQDYRDVEGVYDRIVSIEMFEAVGEAYWPSYFGTLARCLKPGGRAVLQVITIEDSRFEAYRKEVDFIQKHVFPGGFLPSKTAFRSGIEAAGLRMTASETFGTCYARTLAEWRRRFLAQWGSIAPLGFDERFRRLWDYYLCYCEAAFIEGAVDVGLYTIEHPAQAQSHGLFRPPLGDEPNE